MRCVRLLPDTDGLSLPGGEFQESGWILQFLWVFASVRWSPSLGAGPVYLIFRQNRSYGFVLAEFRECRGLLYALHGVFASYP